MFYLLEVARPSNLRTDMEWKVSRAYRGHEPERFYTDLRQHIEAGHEIELVVMQEGILLEEDYFS